MGFELPLPLGVSANFYAEEQNFDLTDLSLGFGGRAQTAIGTFLEASQLETEQANVNARFDVWLLPFLNVYGLLGYTEGNTEGVVLVPSIPLLPPFVVTDPFVLPIDVDYEGPTYGGGVTIAGGFPPIEGRSLLVFAVADGNFTETDLDFLDDDLKNGSEIETYVFSGRLGLRGNLTGDLKGGFWLGAMCQDVDKTQIGVIPSLGLSFTIEQEAEDPCNGLVGGQLEYGEHLQAVLEFGVGKRKAVIGSIALRF